MNPGRLIASPYTRALETVEIVAAELRLPISVEPLIALREESVEASSTRSEIFCNRISREAWSRIADVTHWGFIRAVTGLKVPNGAALRIDPTRPDRRAEPLFLPGRR
jgi:glucosyl-3-phosphoglycerate phosphatase